MRISIIVPVINCKEYTEKFLPTVYSKKHDLKFYLIDNGSHDGTTIMFAKLANEDKKYTFIRNESNKGVAGSWNQGIKIAMADGFDRYFVCNNDILLRKDTIDNLIELMDKEKFGFLTPLNIRDEVMIPEDVFDMKPKELSFSDKGSADFSCFLISKECYKKAGEFDEGFVGGYFEDNDYVWRVYLAGQRIGQTTGAIYYHFGSKTQNQVEGGVIKSTRFEKNRQYFIEKWGCDTQGDFEKMKEHYYKFPFNDNDKKITYVKQYDTAN